MISAMTKDEFTKAAWEVVGCKVEKALMLSDIYETAKASAGTARIPGFRRHPHVPHDAGRGQKSHPTT